jgi:hypothetical protein
MTDPKLDEFDPRAEVVRRQLQTFPLKFRELGEGGELRRILDEDKPQTLQGPLVGQQPEMFTEQYLIEPILHGLGYTDPASTEYEGTGAHFVRRPTTFRSVEANRPDYLLEQVDSALVCILEAKAANREQQSERAATDDIRDYIDVNTFCRYLRDVDHEYLVAIGTDGLRWTLWQSKLQENTKREVCHVDLSAEIKTIAKQLDVIEGEADRTPHNIRGSLRELTKHFAVDRLPAVVKQ